MSTDQLEHANITVKDTDATARFIRVALPTWQVRGQGTMDWFGTTIDWLHVGTDTFYLALQGGGQGDWPHWQSHATGLKHIGLVVASVDAVVARLAAAGHPVDHWGAETPSRRSAYIVSPDGLQFEFVEYLTEDFSARNDYRAS
jgi:catechol 2,3-dioxygenase-like lactoylglutathione lyase family enzyme